MKIKLPNMFYYRIKEGDNFEKICTNFNTNKDTILRNNPKLELYTGEIIIIRQNDYILHYVKPAEVLTDIAVKYDLAKEKIIADNNLKTDKLFIGQQLKIYK